jgi:hypothetical protein
MAVAFATAVLSASPVSADGMKRFTIANVDPNETAPAVKCRSIDGKIESTLYRVDDLGKPGVPGLTPAERSAVAEIRKDTNFTDLRFTYVGPDHRFILFRSTGIICRRELMAYEVLNGRCDEYWSPSDEADKVVRAPACNGAPRPWQSDLH